MMVGDLPAAIQRFNAALELEPEYVPAWVNLAICHQNMRNYDLALQLYDRALECDRNDADTIYNKAYLLYELGRYADAKRLFATVVTLNPRHVSALNYLGLCHGAMNQSDTALKYFEKALAIDHTYVYAVRNRQLVLEEIASGMRKSDRG
jgi:tetratricopeptide (TPR) repeat protein